MNGLQKFGRQLSAYPTAVAGLIIILLLLAIALYTLMAIPYRQAISLWRGGEQWAASPKNARPVWYNLFLREKLPETIDIHSREAGEGGAGSRVEKQSSQVSEEAREILINFEFDYPYDGFPQEISIFFDAQYETKIPFISVAWFTPDGREIRVGDFSLQDGTVYRVSLDERLKRRLNGLAPHVGLFAGPEAENPTPGKGRYRMQVSAIVFSSQDDLDARLVAYGQVHGLAGTDHRRRDLMVALLWGTPIALAFGLLAAVGTTILTMIIAAVGVWYGGAVDEAIQRITELNLILPVLPILIMVGTFYSRSIWLMLGVVILLSIFGQSIKTYRAVFLQVKVAPYTEAARSYGASSPRIILFYMIPRIIPLLIPQFVVLIPSFVFLEASLAVIGLGDPVLPTWGKVIQDAYDNGALFQGLYYWVLEPSLLLVLTGLAFSMFGFALDRIFNPRLREL